MMNFRLRTLSACVALIGSAGIAHGSGFNLLEQNASGLGNAFAGSAASTENASAMYYNPAALTQLEGFQVSTGVNLIDLKFKYKNDGASRLPSAPLIAGRQRNAGNGNGGNAGGLGVVPNLYLSYKVNDRIGLGLGISAPFGLKTEYDDDWIGRFHSQSFDIQTINVNPSIAFKINDSWSVGAGLNLQRIEATYNKRNVAALDSIPGAFFESGTTTKIKNTAYGWNIGAMFHPSEDTRIGLSYRSKIKHKASGHSDVTYDANAIGQDLAPSAVAKEVATKALAQAGMLNPSVDDISNFLRSPRGQQVVAGYLQMNPGALGAASAQITGMANNLIPTYLKSKATVTLPDMAVLSVYHRLNEKWEVMGDVSWIGWSSIPRLTINSYGYNKLGQLKTNQTELDLKFKDSWRVAVGANYAINEKWKLKTGFAWDQSPIRDAEHRPASLPDSNRYWLSLGVQFKPTPNTTIDAGYTHIFAKKSKIRNDNGGKEALYGRISGSFKGSADIFGLQVSHRF